MNNIDKLPFVSFDQWTIIHRYLKTLNNHELRFIALDSMSPLYALELIEKLNLEKKEIKL